MPTTTRSPAFQHFRSSRSVGVAVTAPNLVRGRHTVRDRSPSGQRPFIEPKPTGDIDDTSRRYSCHMEPSTFAPGAFTPGTRIEVRSRFDSRWSRGFEVAEQLEPGLAEPRYLVRRRSDGAVLPAEFAAEEVRSEKRGRSMWWV
jgi:hypothetical protein